MPLVKHEPGKSRIMTERREIVDDISGIKEMDKKTSIEAGFSCDKVKV